MLYKQWDYNVYAFWAMLGYDYALYVLTRIWQGFHLDSVWIDFKAAVYDKDIYQQIFWLVNHAVPPLWILLYYLVVHKFVAETFSKHTCRCLNKDKDKVVFKTQVEPRPVELWPIALPYVGAIKAMYYLPLIYMVSLTFGRLVVNRLFVFAKDSWPTDAVAMSHGRIAQPRPVGTDANSLSSPWRKEWDKMRENMLDIYDNPNKVINEHEFLEESTLLPRLKLSTNIRSMVCRATCSKTSPATGCNRALRTHNHKTTIRPCSFFSACARRIYCTARKHQGRRASVPIVNRVRVTIACLVYAYYFSSRVVFMILVLGVLSLLLF